MQTALNAISVLSRHTNMDKTKFFIEKEIACKIREIVEKKDFNAIKDFVNEGFQIDLLSCETENNEDSIEELLYDLSESLNDEEFILIHMLHINGLLHYAYFKKRWVVIEKIASSNKYTKRQSDMFISSINSYDYKNMKRVLELGFSPIISPESKVGGTPLEQAKLFNCTDTIKLLKQYNAVK